MTSVSESTSSASTCILPVLALLIATSALPLRSADAQRFQWPEEAENLQVLPADFPPQRLSAVMRGFSRSLGVRCSHCHVGEEGQPLSTFDFASDDNPKKDVARQMLQMLGDINDHLDEVDRSGPEPVNMWCHTCHRGVARPMRLEEALMETYTHHGTDAMLAQYSDLRTRHYGRSAYDFGEGSLNSVGYDLLGRENPDTDAAIAIFRLNTKHFPESANAYDSLAEGYMTSGNDDLAVIFYQKSLELNPENRNALEKLGELRARSEQPVTDTTE